MKNIKQLREQFDAASKGSDSESSRLATLIRAGLMDATKLPTIRRALSKDNRVMTPAERNSLLNLLDSLMSQVLADRGTYQRVKTNLHEGVPTQPKNDYLSKFDPRFGYKYPKESVPSIIMLKRKAIRVFPDGQKIGLYYAQAIDKYVSIPFQDINVGVNEEMQQLDEISRKLAQIVHDKRKAQAQELSDKADAETNKAAKDALTKKSSKSFAKAAKSKKIIDKRNKKNLYGNSWYELGLKHRERLDRGATKVANYIKSKRQEKPAETKSEPAAEPKPAPAPVKKTKVVAPKPVKRNVAAGTFASRVPVSESFQIKVAMLREQQNVNEGVVDTADDFMRATGNVLGGNYVAAAGDYVVKKALGRKTTYKKELDQEYEKSAKAEKRSPTATTAGKVAGTALGAAGAIKAGRAALGSGVVRKYGGKILRTLGRLVAGGAGGSGDGKPASGGAEPYKKAIDQKHNFTADAKTSDSFAARTGTDAARRERDRQATAKALKESNFQIVKKVNDNVLTEATLEFNDKTITINSTVAKKIMNLHESVNKTNKKMIEKMLDESASSFNKILTFAVRH